MEKVSQGIHPKTRPFANSTTYKNHIIGKRRFSLIETTESCKQLEELHVVECNKTSIPIDRTCGKLM